MNVCKNHLMIYTKSMLYIIKKYFSNKENIFLIQDLDKLKKNILIILKIMEDFNHKLYGETKRYRIKKKFLKFLKDRCNNCIKFGDYYLTCDDFENGEYVNENIIYHFADNTKICGVFCNLSKEKKSKI